MRLSISVAWQGPNFRKFRRHHIALDTPAPPPPLFAALGWSMTFSRSHFLRFLLPLVLAAMGAGLCALLIPGEREAVIQQLIGFPDSDVRAHEARPVIMAVLCFLPALAALFYAFSGTLDRYVVRQFTGIFFICLSALLMIWLLVDLGDKLPDFRGTDNVIWTVTSFYASRSPAVLSLMIPYSLLLALLYCLGKLSGSREIIAMIQGGRSLVRISLPLLVAGAFFSVLCFGLNYHWGPVAEGNVDLILAEAGGKPAAEASNVLYRDPGNPRLWLIGAFPKDYQLGKPLMNVEITTTRRDRTLESRMFAKSGSWDRNSRKWTFEDAVQGNFQPDQPAVFETHTKPLVVDSWPETPWQLIKPGLDAEFLGIPDLNSWLQANEKIGRFADPAPYLTQWHYRWALPLGCLVTVLLTTPLGIHFSRRGAGGGVFLAVFLAGLMLLLTSISVALGASGTLHPAHGAWLPNVAFALLGIYLFHRRISGQPIYLVLRRLLPGGRD
jgi:LPS export ABC transporter permease LptG